jgi:hypothetical protein
MGCGWVCGVGAVRALIQLNSTQLLKRKVKSPLEHSLRRLSITYAESYGKLTHTSHYNLVQTEITYREN